MQVSLHQDSWHGLITVRQFRNSRLIEIPMTKVGERNWNLSFEVNEQSSLLSLCGHLWGNLFY